MGGSTGHDASLLARNYPKLSLIVQDLPEVEAAFRSHCPSDVSSRITFQKHDFFTPQTCQADAYFLKTILHDWPDKYATRILRNLLPALKPGARILLCEIIATPTYDMQGKHLLPLPIRRMASASDLQMLVLFNSNERSLEDWKRLIKCADERFEVVNVSSVPGALWSLIEVVFGR